MDKRDALIEAARKRFARFGLKKTTMDEIARDVGVGKPSIYELFDGKNQLFESVVRHESDLLIAHIREAVDACDGGPREKLRTLVLTKVRHLKGLRNLNGYQLDLFPELKPFLRKEGKHYWKRERQIVASILAEGAEAGLLEVPNLEYVAFAIVMALKEIEVSWVREHPKTDLEKGLDMMLHILFEGIQKRNGAGLTGRGRGCC